MLGQTPFAGIFSTGQSTAQAITASAAQLVITGGTAMPSTSDRSGKPDCKADPTNNRLIFNSPGIYLVNLDLVGTSASALQTTIQLRKNTLTAIPGIGVFQWATTASIFNCYFVVELTTADIPTAGGLQTFADPSSAVAPYKPVGGFAGAGAAPLTEIPIDILVTGGGSVNLTLTDVRFSAFRIG